MDISFSDKHQAFREEVRTFLDTSLPQDLKAAVAVSTSSLPDYQYNIRLHRILHEKGWVAPAWPEEYGGTGWDIAQQYIWNTESVLAGAPPRAPRRSTHPPRGCRR